MNRRAISDDLQPDTIARLGRVPETTSGRSTPGSLTRSGSTSRSAFGRGPSVFTGGPGQQRVTVKVHLVRHHTPEQGRASLSRHARYIGREGVSRDSERGVFYNAEREVLNARDLPRTWAEDRHHFRVIISPERGQDLADLTDYTRDVMQRVEQDLGTRLEWAAVNHFNTDNPHVHVLLRGRDERQQDLVINRDYIRHGWREQAQEIATMQLGKRTVDHAREAMRKQVHAERWTNLDRILERISTQRKDSFDIDLSKLTLRPGSTVDAEMLHSRLRVLESLGLATNDAKNRGFLRTQKGDSSRRWRLHPRFSAVLNDLGERNDVIKQIHAAMGRNARNVAAQVERLRSGPAPSVGVLGSRQVVQQPQRVEGVVLAKGLVDELTDRRFVVVQDIHSPTPRPVHAVVIASKEYDRIDAGSVVRLVSTRYRQSNLYVQASHRLDEQVSAQAWTWLDRQIYRSLKERDGIRRSWSSPVTQALDERTKWLVAHGFAENLSSKASREALQLKPDARNKLQQAELNASLPEASTMKPGQAVTGRFIGTVNLHLGTVMILDRAEGAVVVPVRRDPQSLEHGDTVRAGMNSNHHVEFEVVPPPQRSQPKVQGRDGELEIGGGR